jgi:hypothetical protein
MQDGTAATQQFPRSTHGEKDGEKGLLLRDYNFVAKSRNDSFERTPIACEASALTTEPTARNCSYLVPGPR